MQYLENANLVVPTPLRKLKKSKKMVRVRRKQRFADIFENIAEMLLRQTAIDPYKSESLTIDNRFNGFRSITLGNK